MGTKTLVHGLGILENSELLLVSETPVVSYPVLGEDQYTNVDWGAYEGEGRPQLELLSFGQLRVAFTDPGSLGDIWTATAEQAEQRFVSADFSRFLIDAELPVYSEDFEDKPPGEVVLTLSSLALAVTSESLRGTVWALDLIRPDSIDGCATNDSGKRRCGEIIEFWEDAGMGSFGYGPSSAYNGGSEFTWEVIEDSVVRLSMTNGTGYVDITRHTDLADGSAIVLTQTVTPAGRYIYHSQAVPLDEGSITQADRESRFTDVPMGNAFSFTVNLVETRQERC